MSKFYKIIKQFLKKVYLRYVPIPIKIYLFKYFKSQRLFYHLNNLKKIGYRPDCIIDIGAYKGDFTFYTKMIFDHSSIIMIEAQEDKEKYLKQIIEGNKNISYEISLLSKSSGLNVPFYEMETGSSIYQEQSNVERKVKYYKTKTLDELVFSKNQYDEYFIKLDVQGAEIDILNGAENVLQKTNFILLEASLLNYNQNAPLISEVIDYLDSKDFVLFDICDENRKSDKTLFQVDLLFSKKNSPQRTAINFKKVY